jgi:3'-5' exoribonuclease
VQEAARRANVEGEYVLLLAHMVISHHGQPDHGSPRPPMFPEAEMLHLLDDMDAKMNEMEGVMRRTPAGAFSEKIWSLDRRLYHPMIHAENAAAQEALAPREEKDLYAGLL